MTITSSRYGDFSAGMLIEPFLFTSSTWQGFIVFGKRRWCLLLQAKSARNTVSSGGMFAVFQLSTVDIPTEGTQLAKRKRVHFEEIP